MGSLVVPLLFVRAWFYYSEKCEAMRMLLSFGGKRISQVECALYDIMLLPTLGLLVVGLALLGIPYVLWTAFFLKKVHNIMLLPTTLQAPEILLSIMPSIVPLQICRWNSTSVPYADIKTVFAGIPNFMEDICALRGVQVST